MKVKKRKTAGKICSSDSSCLQIYVVFCVSLYINPSGCGDSTNVTPVRLCVCVCLSVYVLQQAFILPLHAVLQSKLTSKFCRKHSPVVRQHPPTSKRYFSKEYLPSKVCASRKRRGLDHPGLGSQNSALMWHQHMWHNHSQNTLTKQFYCLLCCIAAPRCRSSGMLQKTKAHNKREKQPPTVPGSENWCRMVTPREGKPAWSDHISIKQLSSKVNRGLIREYNAEYFF